MNQSIVNGVLRDESEISRFLSDIRANNFDIMVFDFDAHADCGKVQRVRKIIEESGFCSSKNCIYGDPEMEPSEYKADKTEPS